MSNFLEFLLDLNLLTHVMIDDGMKEMQQFLTKSANKIKAYLLQINEKSLLLLTP